VTTARDCEIIKHYWIRHYVDNGAIEVVYNQSRNQKDHFLKFRDYVVTDSIRNTTTRTTRQ
jgi:hypothetical protein